MFVDFGSNFSTKDTNGEPLKEVMVGSVTHASPAVVTTVQVPDVGDTITYQRHNLDDGEVVKFRANGTGEESGWCF